MNPKGRKMSKVELKMSKIGLKLEKPGIKSTGTM